MDEAQVAELEALVRRLIAAGGIRGKLVAENLTGLAHHCIRRLDLLSLEHDPGADWPTPPASDRIPSPDEWYVSPPVEGEDPAVSSYRQRVAATVRRFYCDALRFDLSAASGAYLRVLRLLLPPEVTPASERRETEARL